MSYVNLSLYGFSRMQMLYIHTHLVFLVLDRKEPLNLYFKFCFLGKMFEPIIAVPFAGYRTYFVLSLYGLSTIAKNFKFDAVPFLFSIEF